MKMLLLLTLLCNCAYGNVPEQEIVYGHTNGPINDPDAGVDQGFEVDPTSNIPNGCALECVKVQNALPDCWIVCSPTSFEWWKTIPDPGPDGKKQ